MYEPEIRDWLKSFYSGKRNIEDIEITPDIKKRYLRYLTTPGIKPKDVDTELTGTEKLAQSTPVKILGDIGAGTMEGLAGAVRGAEWLGSAISGRARLPKELEEKRTNLANILAKQMEYRAAKSSEMGFEEGSIPKYLAKGLGHAAVSVPLMAGTGPTGAFGSAPIAGAGIVPYSIATGAAEAQKQGKGEMGQLAEGAWSGVIGFVQDKILQGIGKKELSMIPRQLLGGAAMASIPVVADTARQVAEQIAKGKNPTDVKIDWGKVTADFIQGAVFPIGGMKKGAGRKSDAPGLSDQLIERTPGLTEESFNARLEKSLTDNLNRPGPTVSAKPEIAAPKDTQATEIAPRGATSKDILDKKVEILDESPIPPPFTGEVTEVPVGTKSAEEGGLGKTVVGRQVEIILKPDGSWEKSTEGEQGFTKKLKPGERLIREKTGGTGFEEVKAGGTTEVTDKKTLDMLAKSKPQEITETIPETTITERPSEFDQYLTKKPSDMAAPKPEAAITEPPEPPQAPPPVAQKEQIRQTHTNTLKKELGDMVDMLAGETKKYTPESHSAWIDEAANKIKVGGVDGRLADILKKEQFDHIDVKEARLLSDILTKQKRFNELAELTKKREVQGTGGGRTLAAWGFNDVISDPALLATKMFREAKSKLGRLGNKIPEITPDMIKKWTEMAESAAKLPDGPERDIAAAEIFKDMRSNVPTPFWKKVSTIQAIHQLLNAKTIMRNIIGNVGLNSMEIMSHYIGMPIDKALGAITGNRSVAAPKLQKYFNGVAEGFRLSVKDISRGVNTARESLERRIGMKLDGEFENMFEFASGETFKRGVYAQLEKMVGYTMQAPDRAFFEGRFWDALDNMMRASGTTKIEKPLVEQALREAAKVTFRDMNNISKALVKIKAGLNHAIGNENWGLGDLALKYPKVPGAIIKRGIEYSPFGFIESAINWKKSIGNRGDVATQREAAMSSARAVLGTILGATGYALSKAGTVTGKQSENKKLADFEAAIGKRPYSFKALGRLFSYDWFQPSAMPFTMGVDLATKKDIDQKGSNILAQISNYISGAVESAGSTVTEQPVFTGVSRLFGKGTTGKDSGLVSGLMSMAEAAPSSFVPTAIAQVAATIDPTKRNIPNDFGGRMLGLVANRIPGLSKLLDSRKSVLGEDMKRGTGNPVVDIIFNMVSPTIMSKIKKSPETDFIIQLFNETGETEVLPRAYGKTLTYQNKTYQLNQSQVSKLQETAARSALNKINAIMSYGLLKNMSKEKQISTIERIYNQAGKDARVEMLRTIKSQILKDLIANRK